MQGELGDLDPSDLRPPTVEEELAQQLDELKKQAAAKRQQGNKDAAEQGKGDGSKDALGQGNEYDDTPLSAGGRQKRPRDDGGEPSVAEAEGEGKGKGPEGGDADSPTKDGEGQPESNATQSGKEAQEEGASASGDGQEGRKGKGKGRKERWLELPAVPEVRKVGTGQTRPPG